MENRQYTIKLFDQNFELIEDYDLTTRLHPGTVAEMIAIFLTFNGMILENFLEDPAVSGQKAFTF